MVFYLLFEHHILERSRVYLARSPCLERPATLCPQLCLPHDGPSRAPLCESAPRYEGASFEHVSTKAIQRRPSSCFRENYQHLAPSAVDCRNSQYLTKQLKSTRTTICYNTGIEMSRNHKSLPLQVPGSASRTPKVCKSLLSDSVSFDSICTFVLLSDNSSRYYESIPRYH